VAKFLENANKNGRQLGCQFNGTAVFLQGSATKHLGSLTRTHVDINVQAGGSSDPNSVFAFYQKIIEHASATNYHEGAVLN
jgi:hypothetical protein